MGNDLLKQYENGDLTEHEVVNQLFTPFEQIDQSQHPLLAQILQTASGGVLQHHKSAPVPVAPTTNPPGTATNTTTPAAVDKINNLFND